MPDEWVLSTADLTGLGFGPTKVRQLVRAGHLVRLRRGHYRRPLPTDTDAAGNHPLGEPELRHRFLMRATLPDLAAGSVFSHLSAATLPDLPVPARLLDRVCILRPASGSGSITRTAHRRYAPHA